MSDTTQTPALTFTVQREVKPQDVLSLIYGAGGLSYPWWSDAKQMRDGKEVPFDPSLEDAQARDTFEFVHDGEQSDEGAYDATTTVTMAQIVEAAGKAADHIDRTTWYDMTTDNITLADAEAADAVLQIAVFGKVVFG